tara:strand:+ start:98 stop:478 length:381 start_codon:yes stop_codon:yes gene_type:complete
MTEKLNEFLGSETEVIYGSLNPPRKNTNDEVIDTIVQDGKIKDGSEYGKHVKVIESTSQAGNQVFYLYEKVGAVFATSKEENKDLVLQGEMSLGGQDKFVQGYKKLNENGEEWISLSIYPKRDGSN